MSTCFDERPLGRRERSVRADDDVSSILRVGWLLVEADDKPAGSFTPLEPFVREFQAGEQTIANLIVHHLPHFGQGENMTGRRRPQRGQIWG